MVVLAIVGGVVFALTRKDSGTTPLGGGSSGSPGVVTSAPKDAKHHLVTPSTLYGRSSASSDENTSLAKLGPGLATRAAVGEPDIISGAYGVRTADTLIGFIAMTGTIDDPEDALDEAITTALSAAKHSTVTKVDGGSLGGIAKCVDITSTDGAICGWADNDTLAVLLYVGQPLASVQSGFVTARNTIEKLG